MKIYTCIRNAHGLALTFYFIIFLYPSFINFTTNIEKL